MIGTSIRERAAPIRRFLRSVSAKIGRWWATQWRTSSCRARSIRSPAAVIGSDRSGSSLVGSSLCGGWVTKPISVVRPAGSAAPLRASREVGSDGSCLRAVMAWSKPGPTSAQPMSTSDPTASNAALPTSPAVSGSATLSARVARLAKISSRRAGRSWAVVASCSARCRVPSSSPRMDRSTAGATSDATPTGTRRVVGRG